MAYEFNGNNQYLSASDPVDAVPLTIACWFNSDINNALKSIGYVTDANFSHGWGMYLSGSSKLTGYVRGAGGAPTFNTTTNYSVNTWHHACLVCPTNSSRTVYLDAGGSATNTATITPASANITEVRIGWFGNTLDGRIAEFGVWNTALTADEITSLSKGMTCDKIRPQNLVFYAPLVRDLIDTRAARTIINNNAATVATHPRVYA